MRSALRFSKPMQDPSLIHTQYRYLLDILRYHAYPINLATDVFKLLEGVKEIAS